MERSDWKKEVGPGTREVPEEVMTKYRVWFLS